MPDEPTECRPYKSRFGAGYISAHQYLAENMCARLAKRDKIELSDHFWKSKRWEKEFVLQTVHASKLLKEYSIEAIIAALRTTRGQKVFSLGLRSVLVPLIKDEQERIDRKKALSELSKETIVEKPQQARPVEPEKPRPIFSHNKSVLGKLRGI